MASSAAPPSRPTDRTTVVALALITLLGGFFRFYGLAWGAPYYHFHIDEHFVFVGADLLRRSMEAAATSPKFFMYSPLPMYMLNLLVMIYERVAQPLVLSVPKDQVTYMVMGRAISATAGTATIPLVFWIANRVSGRTAGLLAALLLACGVLHLRDSHFLSVDVSMTFFLTLCLAFAVDVAMSGRWRSTIGCGVTLGLALLCKYSAAFLVPFIAAAHLFSPLQPSSWRDARGWFRWAIRAAVPVAIGLGVFLALDPMLWMHFEKAKSDIATLITDPMRGASKPIWTAQFADIEPYSYWFTNVLFWGMGPAFELWSLIGVGWLIRKRTRPGLVVAAFAVIYYLTASRSITPYARYGVPFLPVLAVSAAAFSVDLLNVARWGRWTRAGTGIVVATTVFYAAAYMNIFRQPDSRLAASQYLLENVPRDSKILVEPHHNIPPTGSYLTNPNFYVDYVMWGARTERHDYYRMYTLDTYVYLYKTQVHPAEKQKYIADRLALADYVLMDDTFLQFYQHLPASEHGVVKQYYRHLLGGQLGFHLEKTFKVYPSLFGIGINDDAAELSFRLFDHPRIYLFRRALAAPQRQ